MLLSSAEEFGQTYLRHAVVRRYMLHKEEGEEYRGNSGTTTYVTEAILSSFQPLTVKFSSYEGSHLRTPHARDPINENPASSFHFSSHILLPQAIHLSKFTQKACTGAFGSTITYLEFPLSLDFIPPPRFYHRPHKDQPLPLAYDLRTILARARLPLFPFLSLSSRLPPFPLDFAAWRLMRRVQLAGWV